VLLLVVMVLPAVRKKRDTALQEAEAAEAA
jgi:hypothetical protein